VISVVGFGGVLPAGPGGACVLIVTIWGLRGVPA
jgi:hypothetical protein